MGNTPTTTSTTTTTTKTFCRLCEVNCGLVATVVDGRLTKLRPDHDHPVTRGFACKKGLLAEAVQNDPDRLDRPQMRTADGFVDTDWDTALAGIADGLRSTIDRYGPRSVAAYIGNPNAFNASAGFSLGFLMAMLGSDRLFSAGSQDCSNKFAISEILYGSAELHPIPDIDRTDHLLLLGTDPRVSKGSFWSIGDPIAALRAARDRGVTIRFVNPVVVESGSGIGETIQIRPDTDVYLLAAMLHVIDRDRGFRPSAPPESLANLDGLRDFVRGFPPERVAEVVGIDATTIATMALEFADAPAAAVHMSTGVNMGRQGALAYWLVQMLSLVTGNLDQPGGTWLPTRATRPMGALVPLDDTSFHDSPWGRYRPARSTLPGTLLADMIRADDPPIRALIVASGNPARSIGGSEALAEAFGELDLLVSIDLFRNATGEMAHYVLPAAAQFEREDFNFFTQGVMREPYAQWTDAVLDNGNRREEWWIVGQLADALGLGPLWAPGPSGQPDVLAQIFDDQLADHGLSIGALRTHERGTAVLDEPGPGRFFAEQLMTPDRVLDCRPAILDETCARAETFFRQLEDEPTTQFKLIPRRTPNTLNSAFQNVPQLKERGAADNPLYMHPDDITDLGLHPGGRVEVTSASGRLVAAVAADMNLRRTVVAMTHGFGNAEVDGMRVAQRHPGVNVNLLTPSGVGSFDPISGMSQLTGVPVALNPIT